MLLLSYVVGSLSWNLRGCAALPHWTTPLSLWFTLMHWHADEPPDVSAQWYNMGVLLLRYRCSWNSGRKVTQRSGWGVMLLVFQMSTHASCMMLPVGILVLRPLHGWLTAQMRRHMKVFSVFFHRQHMQWNKNGNSYISYSHNSRQAVRCVYRTTEDMPHTVIYQSDFEYIIFMINKTSQIQDLFNVI